MAKTTKIDEIAFSGRSGQRYDFRVYVWDTKFKAVPGVYVVAARTVEPGQRAQYAPLFAGEARDLSSALKRHPRDECFQMYYGNVIGVLKEDDDRKRASILADLVDGLAPPCNAVDAPQMLTIRHEPAARRFAADVEGATAFISYRETPAKTLDLDHTYVPPAARGSDIASQLTAHALRYARDRGYKVVPSCPFVAAYMRRHTEYRDLSA